MNKERRKDIERAIKLLQDAMPLLDEARSILEDAGNAEREYFDNMHENLQNSERGQLADQAADTLQNITSSLEEANVEEWIGELENTL